VINEISRPLKCSDQTKKQPLVFFGVTVNCLYLENMQDFIKKVTQAGNCFTEQQLDEFYTKIHKVIIERPEFIQAPVPTLTSVSSVSRIAGLRLTTSIHKKNR